MLEFLDGPAAGVRLSCQRAPLLLRVVRSPEVAAAIGGGWDALDQLTDTPADDEEIWVYQKTEDHGAMHLQCAGPGGRGRRCRWEEFADYRLYPTQPDAATLRDTVLWRAWAESQRAALTAPTPTPEVSDGGH